MRLGSRNPAPIDVRVVAATNVNLEKAIAFYRLQVAVRWPYGELIRAFAAILFRSNGRANLPHGIKQKSSSGKDLHVRSLCAFRALHNLEFNVVVFIQTLVPVTSNRGVVDKYVWPVLPSDETESLRVIEPLDDTSDAFHCLSYVTHR
jgi:hypothetical protein